MAKDKDLSLPKVIKDADKQISTIIEKDIEAESKLLKQLVDDVLEANMEIKKRNNERITSTRRKLRELNEEIEALNHTIDTVDRETVVEQLNHMIDAENIIYNAKKQIRFFEQVQLSDRLNTTKTLYHQFHNQVLTMKTTELAFSDLFSEHNMILFGQQKALTEEVVSHFVHNHQEKIQTIKDQLDALGEKRTQLINEEKSYFNTIEQKLERIDDIKAASSAHFSDVEDDINISEKVEQDHQNKLKQIEEKKETLKDTYEAKQMEIKQNFATYYQKQKEKLEANNKEVIEQEKADIKNKNEQLKKIKLRIIDAEKKQNYGKVQQLMREYDQVEKSKKTKVVSKTEKELEITTRKQKEKTIDALRDLKLKYEKDYMHQEYLLELADIEYEEAKILYKIKQDRDALQDNMTISKNVFNELTELLKTRKHKGDIIAKKRLKLRLEELDVMKSYEHIEYSDYDFYQPLLEGLFKMSKKRYEQLVQEIPSFQRLSHFQQYYVDLQKAQLDFYQQVEQLDRQILNKQNQSIIEIEKQKESINSEIIYQESLISVAQKENELQRIKVNALYENERSLAEEQADRIELGIKVNDTFVKSTLENQLLFATQQMECAKSEYDIRLENIALTKEQEMAYALRKIDYYSQKYDYDIHQLENERDKKLEDLEFKRLLFTDKKDNIKIEQSIEKIQTSFDEKIQKIQKQRDSDPDIKRYQKVIDDAEKRADEAMNEAEKLKNETVDAFQLLYDQTKTKFDRIKKTNHAEATEGIVPLLNTSAVSSANDRLKNAVEEADELYQERIQKPQEEIKKLKEALLKITNDEETDAFIKQLKEEKALLAKQLNTTKSKLKQSLNDALEDSDNAIKGFPLEMIERPNPVRTKQQINDDYDVIKEREEREYKDHIKASKSQLKKDLKTHKKDVKRLNKAIKKSLKPYKKYIRYASKGLRAEKKELMKKHKRQLQKHLKKVQDQFIPDLDL
ncbi:MAG: hypothetical protein UMR38_00415 [Candidatus Izemoplasma sp.]|nr:hypothetical protein [Candidatus Izemoplasma sp.]